MTKTYLARGMAKSSLLLVPLALLLASGCATSKQSKTPVHYTFFPPAPNAPRIQFLTSYGSEKDLRGPNSAFNTFITGAVPSDIGIGKPYGIAAQGHKMFLCDTALGGVIILDFDKRRFSVLPPEDETRLAVPINITLDANGDRYIADTGRYQVLCLDATNHLKFLLGKGNELRPSDVAVTADRIYVSDNKGHAVHVYRKDSQELLFSIPKGQDATNHNAVLLLPGNLALDKTGQLYVSDSAAGRVEVYNKEGNYVRTIGLGGDNPGAGDLKRPKGVAVDREGIVYVVDAAYNLVQMYDAKGQYLMCFGYPGSSGPAGMTLPAKVIVDYDDVKFFQDKAAPGFKIDHLVIVTNQFGRRKVAIYGFGHKV